MSAQAPTIKDLGSSIPDSIRRFTPPPRFYPVIATFALFVGMFGAGSIRYEGFSSPQTILSVLVDNSFLIVLAVGMTFVILTGGIDLSVGSVVALSTMIAAATLRAGWPAPLVIVAVLLTGSVLGLLMGLVIHYFEIQPFIVTLAGMFLARGLCYVISLDSIPIKNETFTSFAQGTIMIGDYFITPSVVVALVVLAVAAIVLHMTRFGRTVYAVGGSEQSALLMGLAVARTKVGVYVISGFCSALAGLLFSIYTLSGYNLGAVGMELDAIAAVVIGGTLLTGGSGLVLGSAVGVLVLGLIQSFISFDGTLSSWWTKITIGVLLLVFVLIQRLFTPEGGVTTRPQHAPVMADVAKLAGVSHQTVSRVINGLPNIKETTRARVEAAIKELGYRPNTAARALVTRKSSTIGIISTETGLYGPNSIHRTVEDAARQAGYFAGSVSLSEVTTQSLTDAIDHLLRQSVEGIVMIAAQYAALDVIHHQDPGVPLVVVEGDLSKAKFAVGVDQHRGAYEATKHLLDLGHTTIGHVRGPLEWTEAEARRQGWEAALRDAGHDVGPLILGDWTPASGYDAGRRLLDEKELTAVFVANDQMTIGLMHAMFEAGVTVPDDLSIVGFDDAPEAEFLNPSLTTVRQNFQEVGRRAIDVLHAAILGENEDLPRLIEPELILRSSTCAPGTRKGRK